MNTCRLKIRRYWGFGPQSLQKQSLFKLLFIMDMTNGMHLDTFIPREGQFLSIGLKFLFCLTKESE